MPELRSRRQFLSELPAMAYAVTAPFQKRDRNAIHYGTYQRDARGDVNFVPYSWPKIRSIMGLRKATEEAFYDRLQERYAELTGAYNNATGNGNPDFAKIFGLGRPTPFAPPSRDIPQSKARSLMRMDEVLGGNTPRLRRLKKTLSYADGTWDVNVTPFADGSRIVSPGIFLPIHRGNGVSEDGVYNNSVFVEQYKDGVGVYGASLIDTDMSDLVQQPDEHALLESIERNLNTQVWLADLDEQTFRDAHVMQKAAEKMRESEVVQRYMRDIEEAKKSDNILDFISFGHPYPVMAQPGDESSDQLVLSGEGIFQKGVHEYIEMPVNSQMARHAVFMGKQPYSRRFNVRDLPKEDARLLQEYFSNVISSMRQVDAVFSRV